MSSEISDSDSIEIHALSAVTVSHQLAQQFIVLNQYVETSQAATVASDVTSEIGDM